MSGGDPGIALGIAQCLHARGDAAKALDFIQTECEARPDSFELQHIQGDFLAANKQWDAAATCFVRAYDMNPDDDVALLAGAAAMLAAHDYEGARRMLVERIPKAVRPALLHLALGDVLTKMKRFDEASDALLAGLALAPGHPRGLVLLGALAERTGNREEARRSYREAVNRGSIEAEPRIRLAVFASEDGDREQAIEMYQSALRFEPSNVRVLNNVAVILGEDPERLDEAVEKAGQAFGLEPDDPGIKETYGWLLFRSGKVADGARLLHAAADALQLDATAHYHAGVACARAGRPREAKLHLERCIKNAPDGEHVEEAKSLLKQLRQ
jgi:tetratricopeptide (TPR) repeat protein